MNLIKILKTNIYIALIIMTCLLFSACFSPFMGDEATVTITLGNIASRSGFNQELIPSLVHTVRIQNGPGSNQERTNIKEGDTVSFNVSPGNWDISIDARYNGARMATGSRSAFNVRQGQNNHVEIYMDLIIPDGSADRPFLILNETELSYVGWGIANPNQYQDWDLTKHYIMVENVPLIGGAWTPIGTITFPFTGSFNGNGRTITGLVLNTPSDLTSQGMFGVIGHGAVVRNLNLVNVTVNVAVTNIGTQFGGVVGLNDGTVVNCSVIGSIGSIGNGDIVGGVVGFNSNGTVQNSNFNGTVNGGVFVGGVVGQNHGIVQNSYSTGSVSSTASSFGGVVGANTGTVRNSYSIGDVTGQDLVGGVVGQNDGIVQNSYSTGSVSGTGNRIGGVVGWNDGGTVQNSYALGSVDGNWYIGGVVGDNEGGTVSSSYFAGNVSGDINVGGVVGSNWSGGDIINCYSTGSVSGTGSSNYDIGGVVGLNSSLVRNSYSASRVSGNSFSGGLVGDNRTGGNVQNSVALNPTITRASVGLLTFGRVAGEDNSTLTNNHARDDMVLPLGTLSGIDGTDFALGTSLSSVFNDINDWDPAIWNIPDNTLNVGNPLPTLRNMPGAAQTPTLPVIP